MLKCPLSNESYLISLPKSGVSRVAGDLACDSYLSRIDFTLIDVELHMSV